MFMSANLRQARSLLKHLCGRSVHEIDKILIAFAIEDAAPRRLNSNMMLCGRDFMYTPNSILLNIQVVCPHWEMVSKYHLGYQSIHKAVPT